MSNARFTPGPWTPVIDRDEHGIIKHAGIDTAGREAQVGSVCLDNTDADCDPQIEADCILMASAPELLAACQTAMTLLADNVELSDSSRERLRKKLHDVVSKATPEVSPPKPGVPTQGPWVIGQEPEWSWDDTLPVIDRNKAVVACVWPMMEENARDSAESLANANLICAAPELIEALDNTAAALETCLVHFGDKMYPVDQNSRRTLVDGSKRLIARVRGGAA